MWVRRWNWCSRGHGKAQTKAALRRPAAACGPGTGVGQPPPGVAADEPLGALDLKLRKAMQLELKQIEEEVGITFIYVTHDQEEALTMSNRIAVMDQGLVKQIGTPRDIYEHPHNRFVADFIGETNFVNAKVKALGDFNVLDIGGLDVLGTPDGRSRCAVRMSPWRFVPKRSISTRR